MSFLIALPTGSCTLKIYTNHTHKHAHTAYPVTLSHKRFGCITVRHPALLIWHIHYCRKCASVLVPFYLEVKDFHVYSRN